MVSGFFQVGQRFFQEGQEYRFMRKVEPDLWTFENISTGSWQEKTVDQLLSYWTEGKLHVAGIANDGAATARTSAYQDAAIEAFRQSYPSILWQRAQAKLLYVRRLQRTPLTEAIARPLIEEIHNDKRLWKQGQIFRGPPHFTTVAKWRRRYFDAGEDIRALCDRFHEKGNEKSRFGNEVDALADDVLDTTYLQPERPSIASCLEILRGRIARLNQMRLPSERLARPGFAYLKHKIGRLNPYDVCAARYGKRHAEIKFRSAGMGPQAGAPLKRADIDHCRMDVMVVDDNTGLPLGRPWLTLVLDEATRYILGFNIGFEEPSVVSVSRAVRCALMPKAQLLADCPDLANGWDAWGVIEILVADNGLEFHAGTLDNAIGRFGMVLQFCPRRKPWFKGKIERFFGTLNVGLINWLPGKTFSNVVDKCDYDSAKHAIVGLSALKRIVLTWIVDIYHQKKHRGIGMSPAGAWREQIAGVERWLPPSSLAVESAFSRSDTRRLTHVGIEYSGLLYNSRDLRLLRELHGSEITVEIKVMDEDIGSIVVVVPNSTEIIRVPALNQAYAAGLTRWQHQVCRRYQQRISEDDRLDIALLDARERIRRTLEQERKRGKPLPNFVGRFEETGAVVAEKVARPVSGAPLSESPSLPTQAEVERPSFQIGAEAEEFIPDLASRRVISTLGASHAEE
ncbi:transposase family protein [Xanthomonas hortorum]|nr:transposase family protein [Xanthomonas hortorum]